MDVRRQSAVQGQGQKGLALKDGARVAVVGGGPAGCLFTYFLLRMAETVDLRLKVDIYEPRFFTHRGPSGCNHCGGIVSESLVQLLAIDGINLPSTVVQRGIDSYTLHMDVGTTRIQTPLNEKRIAAVYRANGPKEQEVLGDAGFDRYLQDIAVEKGASIVRKLVNGISWDSGRPQLQFPGGAREVYDLVAVASGVNSHLMESIEGFDSARRAPQTVKTFICEFHLGREMIEQQLGTSMHVFLLDLPRLEFAAIIPKGDFVTVCLLGHEIDQQLVEEFLNSPYVRGCFPGWEVPRHVCHCFPRINIRGAARPYGDRIVFIGDSGVARLYKDGIGSAYRTGKAAAATAVFQGVSAEDFRRHYWPTCRAIDFDNSIGKLVFGVSHFFQRHRISRSAILRMTTREQMAEGGSRAMSSVLWDMFSGSAPYKDIFLRTLHPMFIARLFGNFILGASYRGPERSGTNSEEQPCVRR